MYAKNKNTEDMWEHCAKDRWGKKIKMTKSHKHRRYTYTEGNIQMDKDREKMTTWDELDFDTSIKFSIRKKRKGQGTRPGSRLL